MSRVTYQISVIYIQINHKYLLWQSQTRGVTIHGSTTNTHFDSHKPGVEPIHGATYPRVYMVVIFKAWV